MKRRNDVNLHVALVVNRMKRGGVERYIKDLSTELIERGFRVSLLVLSNKNDTDWLATLVESGVELFEINGNSYHDPIALLKAWQVVRRLRPDVVHFNNTSVNSALLSMLVSGKSRTVLTVHSMVTAGRAYRHMLRGVGAVIAVAPSVAKKVCDFDSGINAEKVVSIYNGINTPAPSGEQKSFDEEVRLLYVGRIARDKNPLDALEITKLLRHMGKHVSLDVVGAAEPDDSALEAELVSRAESSEYSSFVRVHGWRNDVSGFYNQASAMLLLSDAEAFPYTLVDSFHAGVPVFSYPVKGGVLDIHVDGETGVISDSYSIEQLVKKIAAILDADGNLRCFSENCLGISADLSAKSMTSKTIRVYQDAC